MGREGPIEEEAGMVAGSPRDPYPPLAIANWFIRHALENGRVLEIIKLIKLVFFAYGHAFREGGPKTPRPLIKEGFEAWQHGPVSRSVYMAYRARNLGVYVKEELYNSEFHREDGEASMGDIKKDAELINLLHRVYDTYGAMNPFRLSDLTHSAESPWSKAMQTGGLSTPIDNEHVEAYFRDHPLPGD